MKHWFRLLIFTIIISILNPIKISSDHTLIMEKSSSEEPQIFDEDISVLTGTSANIVYYNQKDIRWADKIYGEDDVISIYGCGPTVLAMLVSSLTDEKIQPDEMSKWAYDNGYFCSNSGSYHSIIPDGSAQWGLKVTSITDYTAKNITSLLATGNLIVVLMGNGHFTQNGHFIILRGVSLDGKILIADPASLENTKSEWDPEIIINEAKYGSGNGGPFWSISTY